MAIGGSYTPPTDPLQILYQDAGMVAVDKPSGLLSVPGKSEELADCLVARVAAVFGEAHAVHRLDRDTSGVMLLARNKATLAALGLQFERRQVEKAYVALVAGLVPQEHGTIDLPLIADWPNRPRQMVDHTQGKRAVTHWRVLARTGAATRVALTPETGRSHQLRVHMRELGHPILGDPLYGDPGSAPRLMLHAERLCIRHPETAVRLTLTAPLPF